jgi:hypothetical protein
MAWDEAALDGTWVKDLCVHGTGGGTIDSRCPQQRRLRGPGRNFCRGPGGTGSTAGSELLHLADAATLRPHAMRAPGNRRSHPRQEFGFSG